MKVQAINGTNYRNFNNVNFKSRKDNSPKNSVSDVIHSNAAKVPVIVLLAANPATLNSAIPAQPLDDNKIIAVQPSKTSNVDTETFTDFQSVKEAQQSNAPFGFKYLNAFKIHKSIPVETEFGPADIIFADDSKERQVNRYKSTDPQRVTHIFINFKNMKKTSEANVQPPSLESIGTYTLKDGKKIYAAHIDAPVFDNNSKMAGWMSFETKLDDNTAKELINFYNNKTELHNDWGGKKHEDKFDPEGFKGIENIDEVDKLITHTVGGSTIGDKFERLNIIHNDIKPLLYGSAYVDRGIPSENVAAHIEHSNNQYGWPYLNKFKILKEFPIKTNYGDGVMLYAQNKTAHYKGLNVTDVFLVLNGEKTVTDGDIEPIRIEGVGIHKLENGNDFYGVYVRLPILNNNYKEIGKKHMEFRIDNASANELYKLRNKDETKGFTNFNDNWRHVGTFKSTSPDLSKTEEEYYTQPSQKNNKKEDKDDLPELSEPMLLFPFLIGLGL